MTKQPQKPALDAADDAFTRIQSAAHQSAFGFGQQQPSEAQCAAGNYRVGRAMLHGLPIAIEQPQGSYRTGPNPDGTRWVSRLAAHYGYIGGTRGADGGPVDCYVGPFPESEMAFVINQSARDGKFDEHKVMLGFPDENSARQAYLDSYERGWPGLKSIVPLTIKQFKWWIKNGDTRAPLSADKLPFDGQTTMKRVLWDSATPVQTTYDHLLYDIRRDDGADGLLLDAVTIAEILEDSDGAIALDALVLPMNQLQRKVEILRAVMDRSGGSVKCPAVQVSDPFTARGVTNVAAVFELSDGQTVSIFFHNPDTTPKKIQPTDDMISWKWMLNKKDITIVVAPERGEDLSPRLAGQRIMKLAEKNSAAFQKANAKRSERLASIQGLRDTVTAKEGELNRLLGDIEVAKVEKEQRDLAKQAEPAPVQEQEEAWKAVDPTTPDGYAVVMAAGEEAQRYWAQNGLDALFDKRMVDVGRELTSLGWESAPGGMKVKGDHGAMIRTMTFVINGFNMRYGMKVAIYEGEKRQQIIGDDLTKTPAEIAAEIDAAAPVQEQEEAGSVAERNKWNNALMAAIDAAGLDPFYVTSKMTKVLRAAYEADKTPEEAVEDVKAAMSPVQEQEEAAPAPITNMAAASDEELRERMHYLLGRIDAANKKTGSPVPNEELDEYSEILDEMDLRRRGQGSQDAVAKEGWYETAAKAEAALSRIGYAKDGDEFTKAGKPSARIEAGTTGEGGVWVRVAEFAPDIEQLLIEAAQLAGKTVVETRNVYRDILKSKGKEEADRLLKRTIEIRKPPVQEQEEAGEAEQTKAQRVDAAYQFASATDAFKTTIADSIDKPDYSPFATAKAMDMKAKELGASIEWGMGAALDSVDPDEAEEEGDDDEDDFDPEAEFDAIPDESAELEVVQ